MYDCTLPESIQAEVLDRPDFSSLIRGAGREEAMRDLRASTATSMGAACSVALRFRPLGEAKAGTHHLGFFD